MAGTDSSSSSPYLIVDEDARRLARNLARTARHGALAWLDPTTGAPMTSRVALASDFDGSPLMLLSSLSAHTKGLGADPRLSLLVGEAIAGDDPLRQPRLSIAGHAFQVPAGDREHQRVSRRFSARHPAARTYAGFGDFAFHRVAIDSGLLNAGFARAYRMDGDDLVDPPLPALFSIEARVTRHMNEDHSDVLDALMTKRMGSPQGDWRIATLDRLGFEVVSGDRIERFEFSDIVSTPEGYRSAFVALATTVRP